MQSEGNANHFISIGLNFGILLLAVPFTWKVLSELEKSHEVVKVDPLEGRDGDEEVASDVEQK
jgi:hypothetical protein